MPSFPLLYLNHHIVLKVDTNVGEKYLLLDTGNPFSTFFRYDGVEWLTVCDVTLDVQSAFINPIELMIDWDEVARLVGHPMDGFLGYDLVSQHDLFIDLTRQTISLDGDLSAYETVPLRFFMNTPLVEMRIQSHLVNAVFDTGAMHCILHSQLADALEPQHATIEEYNPILGAFTADLYTADIHLGGTLIPRCTVASAPPYDGAMAMMLGQNVQGFLGIDTLRSLPFCISYQNHALGLLK